MDNILWFLIGGLIGEVIGFSIGYFMGGKKALKIIKKSRPHNNQSKL